MTLAESYLETAVEKLNAGELSGKAYDFINSIKDYSKKQLKNLTSPQFLFLRDIARK